MYIYVVSMYSHSLSLLGFLKQFPTSLSLSTMSGEDPRPKIPHYPLSADESAYLKACMEEMIITTLPVHTPDCSHPNVERDIDDCGNNLCWVIAAMDCVYMNLMIKGADHELIRINCDNLMKCYEDENNGYPYILKKAFKYVKEHNISKDKFYPIEAASNMTPHEIPEEVKFLRLRGFQIIDHESKEALLEAMQNGPFIGGVRHSPEFSMLGKKVYRGSDNEIKIEGKCCNHGLVVLGCGFHEEEWANYWTVKNCDGKRWGDEGYGKIACDTSLPSNRNHLLTSTMFPVFE